MILKSKVYLGECVRSKRSGVCGVVHEFDEKGNAIIYMDNGKVNVVRIDMVWKYYVHDPIIIKDKWEPIYKVKRFAFRYSKNKKQNYPR